MLKFRRLPGLAAIAAEPAVSSADSRIDVRFSAKFVGGPFNGVCADGHESADEAIGALVAAAASEYDNIPDVLAFVSSLFGVDPSRSWQAQLARAVRFANAPSRRVHPGVRVLMPDTAPTPALVAETGGVA
jgi:hypothetical protein